MSPFTSATSVSIGRRTRSSLMAPPGRSSCGLRRRRLRSHPCPDNADRPSVVFLRRQQGRRVVGDSRVHDAGSHLHEVEVGEQEVAQLLVGGVQREMFRRWSVTFLVLGFVEVEGLGRPCGVRAACRPTYGLMLAVFSTQRRCHGVSTARRWKCRRTHWTASERSTPATTARTASAVPVLPMPPPHASSTRSCSARA